VGGVDRGLAALHVPGRGGGPVVVHVAGVPAQLQQHLGAGGSVAQQEHVRRRHDREAVGHRDGWPDVADGVT